MAHSARAVVVLSFIVIALTVIPSAAHAQEGRLNVISANPFGLLLDLFNAEYERAITPSSTAGVGGSFYPRTDEFNGDGDYLNLDAFWRYYVSAQPFQGWALGAKAGYTTNLGVGVGFDVNRSWLVGANDNVYVGVGFGLKRIIGGDSGELEFVPTIRLINVGFAF